MTLKQRSIQMLLTENNLLHAKLSNKHDEIMQSLDDASALALEANQLCAAKADLDREVHERSVAILDEGNREGVTHDDIQTKLADLEDEIDQKRMALENSIDEKLQKARLKYSESVAQRGEKAELHEEMAKKITVELRSFFSVNRPQIEPINCGVKKANKADQDNEEVVSQINNSKNRLGGR